MERAEKIKAPLRAAGLDGILLRNGANRFYATGFSSSAGCVMIMPERAVFFTDSRYIEAARNAVKGMEVVLLDPEHKELNRIKETVSECGIKKLGVEESMSHHDYCRFAEELPGVELEAAEGIIKTLRESKDIEEKNAVLAAQAITEQVFEEILRLIKPGVSEREIAAEIIYRQLKHGAESMSFEPIVAAGANGSMPHHRPGDYVIKAGDFVTMDFGCVKFGYCSDMTRTVAVGTVSDEMRKVYNTVLRAQEAGILAAAPGAEGKTVHGAGSKVIEDAGYGEYFGHGFGHGIGIEVHEGPTAGVLGDKPMPEGAIISAEPGIYLPGRFGVRIEDLIMLTHNGNENLTRARKDLIIL